MYQTCQYGSLGLYKEDRETLPDPEEVHSQEEPRQDLAEQVAFQKSNGILRHSDSGTEGGSQAGDPTDQPRQTHRTRVALEAQEAALALTPSFASSSQRTLSF